MQEWTGREQEPEYIRHCFCDGDLPPNGHFAPQQQRQGLGHELATELFKQLKNIGYDEVRANVQLKNWPALRFWTKVGLTTVTGIYGDQNCSDNTYADVELLINL